MDNYDNDTAFFGMVNSNAAAIKIDENNKKRVKEYFESIEHAIQHSIGVEEIKIEREKEIQINAEKSKKQRKLQISGLILAGAIILSSLFYTYKKIDEYNDIKIVTDMGAKDAENKLLFLLMYKSGGSFTYSNDENVRNKFAALSTSDYAKLTVNNLGEIYSYKIVLGDIEFEEFIKSLRYSENGEERCYTSFQQFLNINGFGSESEFINRAEAVLLEEYEHELHKSKGGI